MQFIRLISDKPGHAFFNMALDEAISDAVRKRISPPTLRFYTWNTPSLSIGHFQKASEIDMEYCVRNKYPLVRRMTGGRAILHDSELTYSISSPLDSAIFRNSLMENYTIISNALVSALKANGMNAENSFKRKQGAAHKDPACFRSVSYGEVTVNGRKIIGSAQKRFSNGFLQHGSILLDFNPAELGMALGHNGKEGFDEIGCIKEHCPDISIAGLKRSLKEAFESSLKIKMIADTPSRFELDLAKELELKKYSTREWNFKR